MSKLNTSLVAATLFAATYLLPTIGISQGNATPPEEFNPQGEFCNRQTFRLIEIDEIKPWLDYLGGLRTGRTTPPDPESCQSATVRQVFTAVTSPTLAEETRRQIVSFYVSTGMEPLNADRARDTSGQFRYLNDITAASLLWVICPNIDGSKAACFDPIISSMPEEFLRTSPVFCDYADDPEPEMPRNMLNYSNDLGLCNSALPNHRRHQNWLNSFSRNIGRE